MISNIMLVLQFENYKWHMLTATIRMTQEIWYGYDSYSKFSSLKFPLSKNKC